MPRWGLLGVLIMTILMFGMLEADSAEFVLGKAATSVPRDGMGNTLWKLQAGKEVRIAYFGGSITAANGWRVKTTQWFRETYPQAKIQEIQASIGGTGSSLGAYRCGQDVLRPKPDLVFVEFAVNDGGDAPEAIWRNMEGILRQIWKAEPTTDICYVYTFRVGYETDLLVGNNPRAASADELLAAHYGIPSINVALPIVEAAKAGTLQYVPPKDAEGKVLPVPEGVTLFSTDGVHPLDAGHVMYTQTITDAIRAMTPAAEVTPHRLPAPFVADNAEDATMVPIDPAMLSTGWKQMPADAPLMKNFSTRMPIIWEAVAPGEKITFTFKGTNAGLYALMGPDAGMVRVTLDGQVTNRNRPISLFDKYCTYHRLNVLQIGQELPNAVHTVTVEVCADPPDKTAVIATEKDKPGFDPKKYDGVTCRLGCILLRGTIVTE